MMLVARRRRLQAKKNAARGIRGRRLTEQSQFKSRAGLSRIYRAAFYSYAGLKSAVRHEAAFRQELALAFVMIPIAAILDVGLLPKALLVGAVLLVLIVELLNSAVEAIVDRVSLEYHELAKRSKDLGSAAVLLSLINCLVIWMLVLIDAYGR